MIFGTHIFLAKDGYAHMYHSGVKKNNTEWEKKQHYKTEEERIRSNESELNSMCIESKQCAYTIST